MVLLALGSIADWNALTPAQQALFAARYNNLFAAWQFLDTIDNPLPDDYRLVYIGSVTENDAWPGTAVNMRTGVDHYIEITALNMTTIFPFISTEIKFEMSMLPGGEGANLRIHDIKFDIGASSAAPALRFRNGGHDLTRIDVYNLIMLGRDPGGILQRIFIDLDSASDGHRMYLNIHNIKMARPYIGIRIGYTNINLGWVPRTIIENVTMDGCDKGKQGIGTITTAANVNWQYTLKNVVAFGFSLGLNSGDFVPNPNAPMPPVNNCADGDGSIAANIATAANCIGNITPVNEFQSLDYANVNYLKLIEGTRTWV